MEKIMKILGKFWKSFKKNFVRHEKQFLENFWIKFVRISSKILWKFQKKIENIVT